MIGTDRASKKESRLQLTYIRWCASYGSVVVDFLFIVYPIVGVCNCSIRHTPSNEYDVPGVS